MTNDEYISSASKEARNKRMIRRLVFINVLVLVFAPPFLFESGFSGKSLLVLTVAFLLLVNGIAWLRSPRRDTEVGAPAKWLFGVGAAAALVGVFDIVSKEYHSAGMILVGSVAVIALGLMKVSRKSN